MVTKMINQKVGHSPGAHPFLSTVVSYPELWWLDEPEETGSSLTSSIERTVEVCLIFNSFFGFMVLPLAATVEWASLERVVSEINTWDMCCLGRRLWQDGQKDKKFAVGLLWVFCWRRCRKIAQWQVIHRKVLNMCGVRGNAEETELFSSFIKSVSHQHSWLLIT